MFFFFFFFAFLPIPFSDCRGPRGGGAARTRHTHTDMLITVLCGSNRSLTLNVSRTIPLSEFKTQVSRETGISVDNMRL